MRWEKDYGLKTMINKRGSNLSRENSSKSISTLSRLFALYRLPYIINVSFYYQFINKGIGNYKNYNKCWAKETSQLRETSISIPVVCFN